MYVHPAFHLDRAASLAFAAERGFGLVAASIDGKPVASPLPFVLDYAADGTPLAAFHVARGNPLAAASCKDKPWLLAVQGDDAYVSPDWYASAEQVPTWLYQSVHLSGPVRPMTGGELAALLDRLGDAFEARLSPKPVWKMEKVAPGRLQMLMKAIVGLEMRIEHVGGSFKLNQHKSDADHVAVAGALAASAAPAAQAIARRMVALRPHLAYEPAATAA